MSADSRRARLPRALVGILGSITSNSSLPTRSSFGSPFRRRLRVLPAIARGRRFPLPLLPAVLVAVLLAPVSAPGQYMYLDSNGNGIHDTADRINGLGVPTRAELWIDTAHNRDGSVAACDTQDGPLSIYSYCVVLHARDGTVKYGAFTNLLTNMYVKIGEGRDATDFVTAYGGPLANAPGLYHLGTLVVTAMSGAPALEFATSTPLLEWGLTSFGGECMSLDYDGTYALGSDWFDADGLGPQGGPDQGPRVSAPSLKTVTEGSPLRFTVFVFDPDGDPIQSLAADQLPPGATFTTAPDNASGDFIWVPGYDAAGSSPYTVTFTALNARELAGTATTQISVANLDRPPLVTAPGGLSVDEGGLLTFYVAASDPDGSAIESLTGAPLPTGAMFEVDASNTSGTFTWTPDFTQAGVYTVIFTASNDLIYAAPTVVTVNNVEGPAIALVDLDPDAINLNSRALWLTAYIEPRGFNPVSIDLPTLRLAGSVPVVPKFAVVGDHNRNGAPDLMVKFSRELLDPMLIPGVNVLELTGTLSSGEKFRGADSVRVIDPPDVPLSASVAPNPLNPGGVLTFSTTRPGAAMVRIFDLQGRPVRTLMKTPLLPAGAHELRIDGRTDGGQGLASGVYFYRVETAEGIVSGRVAVLK